MSDKIHRTSRTQTTSDAKPQSLPLEVCETVLQTLDLFVAACLAITSMPWYNIYQKSQSNLISLDHVSVLKWKLRGPQETTFYTLHYLLEDWKKPNWTRDPGQGIFRMKGKAGTAMSEEDFQAWGGLTK